MFRLILSVLSLRKPPRILIYAVRNKIDRWLKTGNRRFEFERRYLEYQDAWNYSSSPYEQQKYDRTLAALVAVRDATSNILEVGCSIGVFTKMLASHFRAVTAIDVSKEAIRTAIEYAKTCNNVRFLTGDLRTLSLDEKYDAIICAEVLYYIAQSDAPLVCKKLDQNLAPGGIILMVTLQNKPQQNFFYFDAWEEAFAPYFTCVSKEIVQDDRRPYEIVTFARHLK